MDDYTVVLEGEPVGPEHYIKTLKAELKIAKHFGFRVVLDVYDAEQLVQILDRSAVRL